MIFQTLNFKDIKELPFVYLFLKGSSLMVVSIKWTGGITSIKLYNSEMDETIMLH